MTQPSSEALAALRLAANDPSRVGGLTHQHYKYPARFSPSFVRAVLKELTKPDDVVLDPYMGGGTTVVEALALGRKVIGSDLNSLAVFVARAKTTTLTHAEAQEFLAWATEAQHFSYRDPVPELAEEETNRTRNLHLPRTRALKKYLSLALASCAKLNSPQSEMFARAVLLNVSQWALNGRKTMPTLAEFRMRVVSQGQLMLNAHQKFQNKVMSSEAPVLLHGSAEHLSQQAPFSTGKLVDCVITSPPYPGVHILYHRWQVDGRKETPAPYWIANCLDGQGGAYYNFGGRKQVSQDNYFDASLKTLCGIRQVMRQGALFVQMIAFSNPRNQLPRYLATMKCAGFREIRKESGRRIWRQVPSRSWHAELQGKTNSAREVVLIHEAL
jgi:DNA modification methylase